MAEKYYETLPDTSRTAFGSVTGTNAGTANTLLALTNDRRILVLVNSLNQDIVITYTPHGGAVKDGYLYLESNDNLVIDFETSGLRAKSGGVFKAYYSGSAPTSGSIRLHAF
jgi:hypothetical protein